MTRMERDFDVIIIGGGHAGCEAAHASARIGCKTALITMDTSKIGVMSCNPAIGGLAKGQLAREIDALGGLMGRITDLTAIQYRKLNASKGPAVRSSRAQCDKNLYAKTMQEIMRRVENLSILQAEVTDLAIQGGRVVGIKLKDGSLIPSKAVVITSGTFLSAVMHTGEEKVQGGRVGDQAAFGLSRSLSDLGFRLRRLKTGTPPRLSAKSIDFSSKVFEPQPGDRDPSPFSYYVRPNPFPMLPQISCYITYTNENTHEVIADNMHRSPMYSGAIQGRGPRYCPSIEDKIHRFRDKPRHQIFLEPEGLDVDEIYVNGVSTSLPSDVQEAFIRTVAGLENAQFLRYGYAVEYDAIDSRQLKATMEAKEIPGLFLAGQVNGTSGYEEAGGQGLVAGINAALGVKGLSPFTLSRLDAYIGVLIDDLVLKGSDEPYRMFTSRAEYRLLLREDNSDLRLAEKGFKAGVLEEKYFRMVENKKEAIESWKSKLSSQFIYPKAPVNEVFKQKGWSPLKDRVSHLEFLRRPEVNWGVLEEFGLEKGADSSVSEQIEINTKYEGYIKRDLALLEGVRKNEAQKIPLELDYGKVAGLSNEVKAKLGETKPETIGQASRISGITPAAVANLLIHLKMNHDKNIKLGEYR